MLRLGTLLFISNSHCFRINKHVLEHDLTSFPTVLKKWSPLLNWARHSAVIQSMGVLMLASHCYCLVAKAYLTLATPWAVAHQALLSMGLPRQEYWCGLPFPPTGDLLDPKGIFFTAEPPAKVLLIFKFSLSYLYFKFHFPL